MSHKIIEVQQDDDGQRLDRWLKRELPDVPYVLMQKLIRKGALRVDGKRVKTDTRLSAGQAVKIPASGTGSGTANERKKISAKDKAFIQSLVIFDDGEVIALNKPSGLAVQGGSGQKVHVDGFLDGLKGADGVRPKLVHRLDKDTSGVLLLARSTAIARTLGVSFKGKNVKKIYMALVQGVPEVASGTIKAKLAKGGGANKERMRVDNESGKMAITEYTLLDKAGEAYSSVAFWPRTGRTHQIRVHAEIAGFPIVGDNKYRGYDELGDVKRDDNDLDFSERLHLHAYRIALPHPSGNGTLDITAPLPGALKKSWHGLGFDVGLKDDPFEGLEI